LTQTGKSRFSVLSSGKAALCRLLADHLTEDLEEQSLVQFFSEMTDQDFIEYLYITFLQRPPDEQGMLGKLEALAKGVSRITLLENVLRSQEFQTQFNQERTIAPTQTSPIFSHLNDEEFVQYLYTTFLKRPVDLPGLQGNLQKLANGVPRSSILEAFLSSEEFRRVHQPVILEQFSDDEFLHLLWQVFLGRSCDYKVWQQWLSRFDKDSTRLSVLINLLNSPEFQKRIDSIVTFEGEQAPLNSARVMGTQQFINQEQWHEILVNVLVSRLSGLPKAESPALQEFSSFSIPPSNTPLVSIITSLYKGREYIESFMENITTQTIFRDHCELIIIDANSPEAEFEIIEPYMKVFDNIHYVRTERVISIYEAWNLAIAKSEGMFLTNANVDDLRRYDCLEKQAAALLEQENYDVVYQDFFYTLTPNLPFDVVASCNIKSELPIATKATMMQMNLPHNAPMWRKSMHSAIGVFNTSYQSAGDYEFWLRGLLNGARFLKLQEPLVAYYNNPMGISTRRDSLGVSEAQAIQRVYIRLFSSYFVSMPKGEYIHFCYETFQIDPHLGLHEPWSDRGTLLYQCFIHKLKELSATKFYLSLS
jgi:glycosyltransferase involved in cell wall biosynthesis